MDIKVKGEVPTPAEAPLENVSKVAPKQNVRLSLKLIKNWTPRETDDVVILGWKKPAVHVRRAEGGSYEQEPEKFIPDEMHPAPVPGALSHTFSERNVAKRGQPPVYEHAEWTKIWAGTYVEVPEEVAYFLMGIKAGEMARGA